MTLTSLVSPGLDWPRLSQGLCGRTSRLGSSAGQPGRCPFEHHSRTRPAARQDWCQVGPKDASWPMHSCGNTASYKRLKLAQLLGRLGVVLTCTPTPMVSPMFIVACTHPQGTNSTSPVCCRHPTGLRSTGSVGRISLSQWLKLTSGSGMSAVSILLGSYRNQAFDPAVKYSHDCPVIARMVLGWPKRCKLVHVFLWIK